MLWGVGGGGQLEPGSEKTTTTKNRPKWAGRARGFETNGIQTRGQPGQQLSPGQGMRLD